LNYLRFFFEEGKKVGTGENLRDLANGIIDSYEIRVKTVNGLMEQAYHFLSNFHTQLEEMIVQLKDNLAKSESLRKKDFDRMMIGLTVRRRSSEELAEKVFQNFQKEEQEMIGRLRNIIVSGGSNLDDMEIIKEDILNRQKERETGIVQALKRIQMEQEELKTALKILLEKGETVKLRDFKRMLKSLSIQQGVRDNQVGRLLQDLDMVRERVQTQWQTAAAAAH
jgi:hypothetical protein